MLITAIVALILTIWLIYACVKDLSEAMSDADKLPGFRLEFTNKAPDYYCMLCLNRFAYKAIKVERLAGVRAQTLKCCHCGREFKDDIAQELLD